jgi:hypothetical protein
MSDFTPADHVTEREPGRWEDCTFASVLETIRICLPNGRAIPATIDEVNRFRANVPLPDNHDGVTIGQTLPAAKQLYGLQDSQYTLTREWSTLAPALEDPTKACVVTGSCAHIPANERVTSFMGAHAVAKHGVRIRCDPLGPKDGIYQGNTWSLAIWRSFTHGLPYWQAMIMDQQGGSMPLSIGGVTVTSNKVAVVQKTTALLAEIGGSKVANAQPGYRYPLIGSDSGYRMVIVRTGLPYPDKVPRDTGLYILAADIKTEDAPTPPPPAGGSDTGPTVQAKWEAWVTTHPK